MRSRYKSFSGFSARVVVFVVGVSLFGLVGVSGASAQAPSWHLVSRTQPSVIPPGGEGTVIVQGVNLGDAPAPGRATLRDVLPPGLSIVEKEGVPRVEFFVFAFFRGRFDLGPASLFPEVRSAHTCEVAGSSVSCHTPFEETSFAKFFERINPYEDIEMRIRVKAEAGASSAPNRAEASGGGVPATSSARTLQISPGPLPFGVEQFSIVPEDEGGGVDTRAGSHPFQLTTTLAFNQNDDPLRPPALPRNLRFKLPPGQLANVTAIPQCSDLDFRHVIKGGIVNLCPGDTAIGVAAVTIDEPEFLGLVSWPVPLFNLVPKRGEPARFGFEIGGSPVTLDASVRTGSDYGVTISVNNITQLTTFLSSTVTFWGVPGDPVHDASRGWGCLVGGQWAEESGQPCTPSSQAKPPPFLTLPTSCAGPFEPVMQGNGWPTKANPSGAVFVPAPYALQDSFGRALGMTACNQLALDPFLEVKPDVQSSSTVSGLAVHVRVPQEVNENAKGLASSNVKDIAVTFPEGVTVNPAAADGLQACSEAQMGFTGFVRLNPVTEPENETAQLTPGDPSCPDASKIGTVSIKSPLLPAGQPLEGALYLATPAPHGEAGLNPFNSLLAAYIVAKDQISGVLLKLPGEISLDPVTGRVTATFKNNPQLTFEDAEVHLFGGSRGPFSTPAHCGSYTTEAALTPWSGMPAVSSSSTFEVRTGPNGGPCPGGALPFAPSLAAGMTNIQAGAFSPLTTTIGRADGEQNLQTVQLHMPPGLSGILSGVKLCDEADANAGTCAPESEIGHTIVSVGLGGDPFSVTGGKVYLTEKYRGAPFGLSIVNPAKAGPFDLGKVVVRARIEVDPSTTELTITTDDSGPYAIPHILDGIPLQIKHVNVTIDRPGFTFNSTNCNPQAITGTIGSVEGASSPVSVPFQVTNCATLKFAPKFSVSTSGTTSKQNGASLTAKLSEPNEPYGSQANIARVKVELPKQLPSRLTTLQKACTNAQFEANPAGCPPASFIGHAVVHTPLLPVPLTGPAIFVSHGGEAFPSLVMVLRGYGVTVDLVGTTFISKTGITSTTFKTIPDVPFNTFELVLPQGKFSALTSNLPAKANNSFCAQKLVMPSEFIAQNGAVLHQSTPVTPTGCAKKKALTRKQKLATALKACKKQAKSKREACIKQARKKFGPPASVGRKHKRK